MFVLYFAGLDHKAHYAGMSGYTEFFSETTDDEIEDIVNWLKKYDEFDNKIFIITADHGHTAMPHPMYYKDPKDGQQREADTSCKLNLKDFDKENIQNKEKYNNNLHIWELANLFTLFPSPYPDIKLKVLAPKEIAEILDGATADINEANVIAAMNGPMAHVYIKGADWQGDPGQTIMGMVLDRLNKVLRKGATATGSFREKIQKYFPRLDSAIDAILIRKTLNSAYEVLDNIGEDAQGKVINTIPLETYLSTRPEFVGALERISRMNNKDRSGDIILIFKDDTNDNPLNRFSSGSACKSWHGSLNPSDSYVPLIVAYPGGNRYELEPLINNTEGCNVILGCDGNWRTTDLIREIIEAQYSRQ